MCKIIHSKIFLSYFGSTISSGESLVVQIVANLGSKNMTRNKRFFASLALNSVPYQQVSTMQTKCMEWTPIKRLISIQFHP